MSYEDDIAELRPGNPLRVACRTCLAPPRFECNGPTINVHGRRWHKKRVRDGLRDFRDNGAAPRPERVRPKWRDNSPRKWIEHPTEKPIATVGDRPDVARALSDAYQEANKTMQTPGYWHSVWSDPTDEREGRG